MLYHRPSQARGHANHGWLDSHHTFSFAGYYDPAFMGFRDLRVINEDRVKANQGFGTHSHQDMEIISFIIAGALEHKDNMGHTQVLRPGEVQRMSAGTGVTHSEYNPSQVEEAHFLQIWILPQRKGIKPDYEQKNFTERFQKGDLTLVVSPDGRKDSLSINQDATLSVGQLQAGQSMDIAVPSNRHAWIQMIHGQLRVNGLTLKAGDGAAISEENHLHLVGESQGQFLFFDLA